MFDELKEVKYVNEMQGLQLKSETYLEPKRILILLNYNCIMIIYSVTDHCPIFRLTTLLRPSHQKDQYVPVLFVIK